MNVDRSLEEAEWTQQRPAGGRQSMRQGHWEDVMEDFLLKRGGENENQVKYLENVAQSSHWRSVEIPSWHRCRN